MTISNTTIQKSIEIHAPKNKVWQVLTDNQYTSSWYAIFSEGTHAETDWTPGSKVLFIDQSKSGLIGKVKVNQPFDLLSIEYQGIVNDGVEDYDSEMAQQLRGGHENYYLSEHDNITKLSIACDMSPDLFESMSLSWENALQKIKELSLSISKNALGEEAMN